MARDADPFDRAVAREAHIRRRAAALDSPRSFMRLALRLLVVLGVGWAALLAGHWFVFPEPRWLAVLHTVVFALTCGFYLVTLGFLRSMESRRPDLFRDE